MVRLGIQHLSRERQPNICKFNNSYLQEQHFVTTIKQLNDIRDKNNDIKDLRLKYDFLKYEIQQFTMQYGIQRERERR